MGHTPGPWSLCPRPSREHPPGDDFVIAKDGRIIAEIVFPTDSRAIIDALLMRSAPEMLKALEEVNAFLAEYGFDGDEWAVATHEVVKSTLTKAKGESK